MRTLFANIIVEQATASQISSINVKMDDKFVGYFYSCPKRD
jgi:hypothetical protein